MLKVKVNDQEALNVEFESEATGTIDGVPFSWDTIEVKEGMFHIIKDHKSYTVEVVSSDSEEKTFTIKVNGNSYSIEVKDKYDALLKQLGLDNLASKKVNELKAPMPGLVIEIHVAKGDEVKIGDPLLVLEAMKMENVIKSPTDGIISKVNLTKGVAVEKNEVLINFE